MTDGENRTRAGSNTEQHNLMESAGVLTFISTVSAPSPQTNKTAVWSEPWCCAQRDHFTETVSLGLTSLKQSRLQRSFFWLLLVFYVSCCVPAFFHINCSCKGAEQHSSLCVHFALLLLYDSLFRKLLKLEDTVKLVKSVWGSQHDKEEEEISESERFLCFTLLAPPAEKVKRGRFLCCRTAVSAQVNGFKSDGIAGLLVDFLPNRVGVFPLSLLCFLSGQMNKTGHQHIHRGWMCWCQKTVHFCQKELAEPQRRIKVVGFSFSSCHLE